MKKLVVFDGNSILNRAFYGIRPLTTRDGLHTNALYGMMNIFLGHLERTAPDYAAVAFDLPAPTFRHRAYTGYKATRRGMPPELAEQLPYAKQCAAGLGLEVLELAGWEADDILGTLSRTAADEGVMTYLVTGDRDSLQLINDTTHVLLTLNSETAEYDRERFVSEFGVPPEKLVDVKALMGDSSDNIPGVPGVGEKTAYRLIAAFGSLDGVYENLDRREITKSVRTKLDEGKDSAYLSRRLAKIDLGAPLTRDGRSLALSDLAYGGPDRKTLLGLFGKLEFTALIKRMKLSVESEAVLYEHITPEELPARIGNSPAAVAVTFSSDGGELHAAKASGDARFVCEFQAASQLRPFFEDDRELYVCDSKKLVAQLREAGIKPRCRFTFDAVLAAYVLNSSDSAYTPTRLSSEYLGEAYEEDGPGECELVRRLRPELIRRLESENVWRLYADTELPLAGVLLEMEETGFKVDTDGLAAYSAALDKLCAEYAGRVFELVGYEFNLNSPKQLGEALYEKLGLPSPKRGKTGYSTSAEILEKLRPYSPVIGNILDYRQAAKLKSTYADGLLKVADAHGRVHTTFTQTVTSTGRLSSVEPNLQNIPIRQELGRELRRYFIPEDSDHVLVDADYSQIELRLLAHISDDEVMKNAFLTGEDIHATTASQVFGVPLAEVTPEQRKRAKAVNFGIVYGIGDFSLAEDIGVTKAQAAEYIRGYLEKYSGVDAYMKRVVESALRDGYVATLAGRRRYIPELKSPKASLRAFGERVAMNSPIQGTAADIIKTAMLNVSRALKAEKLDAKLILQVHDELVLESSRDCAAAAAALLKREMESAAALSVPLTVDVTIGDTWYK